MRFGSLSGMTLLFYVGCTAFAHGQNPRPEDLRPEALQPRIGVISEDVLLEKFKSYGVDIAKLERHENAYIVHAQIEGRSTVLEVDRLSGAVRQEGKAFGLKPSERAIPFAAKPDPKRVPWSERAMRFEKIGPEGMRLPAQPGK